MKWPMHITLTVENLTTATPPRDYLRRMMKAFSKLRRAKLFTKNVSGGVVAVEVTDKGRGLHPHLHALIDCRWLALKTPHPHRDDDKATLRTKYRCAAEELSAAWARAIGQETPPSVFIRRADHRAAKEIVKYALKSEDAVNCEGEIAPVLRMLDACRAVATWGHMRGVKLPEEEKVKLICPNGHSEWSPTPPTTAKWEDLPAKLKLAKILSGSVSRYR